MARSIPRSPDGTVAEQKTRARRGADPKADARSRPPAAAPGQVKIGPVAAIPDLLREFGVKPSIPFGRAGVPLRTFENPENRIAFESLGLLFMECSTLTACEHFGLLVGECFELTGLGAIGYLMRNSPTVGDALRALLLNLYLHDRGAVPILIHSDSSHVHAWLLHLSARHTRHRAPLRRSHCNRVPRAPGRPGPAISAGRSRGSWMDSAAAITTTSVAQP